MSLAYDHATVPAHPLGIPVDGRERYGMTAEQAILYRWLVKYRPHDKVFCLNFREIARLTTSGLQNVHDRVTGLCERGWLERMPESNHMRPRYRFVHPIMHFKVPRG